jgi:hypothetical protein
MAEIEVEFVDGRPRGFRTEIAHAVMYHRRRPALLLVPAEVARRMPGEVSRALQEMGLVRISVEKLEELVERVERWLATRMVEEGFVQIEWAFRERCYLGAIEGHVNLVLRNPHESAMGEVVRVAKLQVEYRVVNGRWLGFGVGAG